MTEQFEITTTANKTMFGKRTGGHKAALRPVGGSMVLDADGANVTEAKSALLNKLGRMAQHTYQHTYVFCGDGQTVLVVHFAGECWGYDIVDAERSVPCGCWMPNAGPLEAIQAAKSHAEQSYGGVRKVLG